MSIIYHHNLCICALNTVASISTHHIFRKEKKENMGGSNGTNMHVCFLIAVEKMVNSAAVILYKEQLFVCVVCAGHVQVRSAHAAAL